MPETNRTSVKSPPKKLVAQPDGAAMEPAHDLADYLKEYARERPEVVALWCFGLGFVIGWKIKPW